MECIVIIITLLASFQLNQKEEKSEFANCSMNIFLFRE